MNFQFFHRNNNFFEKLSGRKILCIFAFPVLYNDWAGILRIFFHFHNNMFLVYKYIHIYIGKCFDHLQLMLGLPQGYQDICSYIYVDPESKKYFGHCMCYCIYNHQLNKIFFQSNHDWFQRDNRIYLNNNIYRFYHHNMWIYFLILSHND